MIKFKAGGDGGTLYGFGLSFRNLELLREGRPIKIDGAEMGLPAGTELLLFAMETEAEMVSYMREKGFLDRLKAVHPLREEGE